MPSSWSETFSKYNNTKFSVEFLQHCRPTDKWYSHVPEGTDAERFESPSEMFHACREYTLKNIVPSEKGESVYVTYVRYFKYALDKTRGDLILGRFPEGGGDGFGRIEGDRVKKVFAKEIKESNQASSAFTVPIAERHSSKRWHRQV